MAAQIRIRSLLELARVSWSAGDVGIPSPGLAGGIDEAIVLVHGLCGNPRTLRPLYRFLRRSFDGPILNVPIGLGLGDIRDVSSEIDRQLDAWDVQRCHVVGYSLGGLVATWLLKSLDQGRRVRRVVTLGTPHRGVELNGPAWAALAACSRSLAQMRAGSSFLTQLDRLPVPSGCEIVSIASSADGLVSPSAARVAGPGCSNLLVHGTDHWKLVISRQVLRYVHNTLELAQATLEPETGPEPAASPLPLSACAGIAAR